MKMCNEKYEIATYPNTIIAWRTGAEVLQIYLLKQAPHCEPGKGVWRRLPNPSRRCNCLYKIPNAILGGCLLKNPDIIKERNSKLWRYKITYRSVLRTDPATNAVDNQGQRPIGIMISKRVMIWIIKPILENHHSLEIPHERTKEQSVCCFVSLNQYWGIFAEANQRKVTSFSKPWVDTVTIALEIPRIGWGGPLLIFQNPSGKHVFFKNRQ